jgi:HlyD family secretion protein
MREAHRLDRADEDRVASRLAALRIEAEPAAPARQRSRRTWGMAAGALVMASLALLWLAGNGSERTGREARAEPAAVPPPAPVASPAELVLGGYVQAGREVHLGAAVSGVVRAVFVLPGSRVKVGQRIAELANDTLKAQVEQAHATLATRQAELRELQNGPLAAELQRARAQLDVLRVELERAERALERQRALAADGLVSRSDLERAQEDREVAAARLEAGRRDEELLAQGARPERRSRAEAALAEAQAALDLAEAQVDQTVIRSPIEGVVTTQHTQVGELVSAGYGGGASAAIVTIADVSRLVIAIDVPHADLGRIRLGQPVRVESEALGGQSFPGRVSWIGPEANRQKLSVPIETEIVGEAQGLLPGLSAKVTFLAGAAAAVTAPSPQAQQHPDQGGSLP